MKLLITGGNGQLAYDLKRLAEEMGIQIFVPYRDELDITNLTAVAEAVEEHNPDFVINTAAFTKVDHAEKLIEQANAVNFYGAKNLAIVCKKFERPLLHLSTDYVFDGAATRPYLETDPVSPINVYGETKRRGEEYIQANCDQYIILRVSGVFGVHGNNFVKTMLRLAREQNDMRIIADQITCPTPSAAIAEILLKICKKPQWGLFHYCGAKKTTWFRFANAILKVARDYETFKVKKIDPVSTNDYPTAARRPMYSVLNCDKILSTFGIEQPDWETGLEDVIKSLYTA